ncbi:type III pantothenate kinase [Sciscionella sediminilitoris]|uniref:type III pantothenate kinase n=1 Tax=Sciscionella sediminilitoris TaxID=1445613 RepID=UPI0004DF429E|nr:type III pantothenate kinase [Sciscionella sp. SE31]
MLLCIDVGNTNTALGLYPDEPGRGPELTRLWRMRTVPAITADELALQLRGLLGEYADRITGVAALSTVPTVRHELREMLSGYYASLPTVLVEPGVRTGVALHVDSPRELGADRLVNTLAARELFGTACIVVDFGTSTNIDVISADGKFLGGAIASGVTISLDALAMRTATLHKVELVRPRAVIGRNTVECLQSGMLYGFAGQVDGIVGRIKTELGLDEVTVVATGGLAGLLVGETAVIDRHVPELTLYGLRLVFERNRG